MKKLRVWYGLRRLTAKAIKKPSIIVIFENEYMAKNEASVNQKMKVLHERYQTEAEMIDVENCNRVFTVYEMQFFDNKTYKNSPLLAAENNFKADANHVSLEERTIIKEKLLNEVYRFYGITEPKELQLQLF